MAVVIIGRRSWGGGRDEEGHREYIVVHRVRCSDPQNEGPAAVLATPGLPQPGSFWAFGSDIDTWAWCRPRAQLRPAPEISAGEPISQWDVEQTFSTKPPPINQQRCNDVQIEDPLLEPPRVSGSYNRYQTEAVYDRFGVPIQTSSHEQVRGPQNEWDANRLTIRIEQNVSSVYQAVVLPTIMADCLNDSPIWGLPTRTVKLTPAGWERRFFGQCFAYYNRVLEFEVRFEGWDRDLLDEGQKVLKGHWDETTGEWTLDQIDGSDPDPGNPSHFIKMADTNGNPIKIALNGQGQPAGTYVESGTFYVSMQPSNLGNPLSRLSYWRKINGSTAAPAWDSATKYYPGNVVTFGGLAFIASTRIKGRTPEVVANPFNPWKRCGSTVSGGLTSQGTYSNLTTYTIGDFVQSPGLETEAGLIHVEKYNEANFLFLGVPSTF